MLFLCRVIVSRIGYATYHVRQARDSASTTITKHSKNPRSSAIITDTYVTSCENTGNGRQGHFSTFLNGILSSTAIQKTRLTYVTHYTSLFLLPLLLISGVARADSFIRDPNIKIARHEKRQSGVKFYKPRSQVLKFASGLMFQRNYWEQPTQEEELFVSYDKLSTCEKSKVDLIPVYHHTPGSEAYDVLYFNTKDPKQLQKAKKYKGGLVPYIPALVKDAKTKELDPWQVFARMMQIKCLPTRFSFTYVGNQRYMSFRMGDAAWE